jgi:hypothetical protein
MRKTNYFTRNKIVDHGAATRLILNEDYFQVSNGSPRANGRLRLRSNAFQRYYTHNIKYRAYGNDPAYSALWPVASGPGEGGANTPHSSLAMNGAYNKAYARLRGKLYEGSASLGVTLGSYKQSADMIRSRSRDLAEIFSGRTVTYASSGKRQSLASGHLEWIFGWKPLLQDMWNACSSVIQMADRRTAVTGHGTSYFEEVLYVSGANREVRTGICRASVSTLVSISNPNLWLLERAGLCNPAAVAWDLIPWSFLVGMVVNVGQLVNSITDFVGLSFDNQSTTRDVKSVSEIFKENTYPREHPFFGGSVSIYENQSKDRVIGSIPRPTLEFKVPEANWETAAMLASLAVQRFRKLDRLISVSNPFQVK